MVEIAVHGGDLDRESPLVFAQLTREQLGGASVPGEGPIAGQAEGGALALRETTSSGGPSSALIPAQYDPGAGTVAFVVSGRLAPGSSRQFEVVLDAAPGDIARAAQCAVEVVQKLDRAVFLVGGRPFATYNVAGGRRPYFWPVLGPSGASVVRGQGTGDHPHHTGLGLAYGGHSEGGSVNIWSDWDEPPYGPGGRMVHRGFRVVRSGPVYGEVVHDLTYVDSYGTAFAEEVRTIRCWWTSDGARFLDLYSEVQSVRDRGTQPFLWALRLPAFFGIPETGRVTNGAGYPVPAPEGQPREYRAAWVDGSGPTGDPPAAPATAPPEVLVDLPGYEPPKKGPGAGPWNGIALLDHPTNEGYPNTIGKYAGSRGMAQLTQVHYPPANAPHGPFGFRQRVYVHDGDAEAARVADVQADYAAPCRTEVR